MKKLFSALLALTMAFVLIVPLAACGDKGNGKDTGKDTEETEYTLTYAANGGEGTAPAAEHYKEGATVTVKPATTFTREGYTFKTWNDGSKDIAAGATFTMPAKNVTLTAQWDEVKPQRDPLTKETDFEALFSDKVTEAEWDAAFSNEGFAGCSVDYSMGDREMTFQFGYKPFDGGYDFCSRVLGEVDGVATMQDYIIARVEGTTATAYRTNPETGKVYYQDMSLEGEDERTKISREWYLTFRSMIAYDLSGKFSEFTYDETAHAYTYSGDTLKVDYSPMEAMAVYTVEQATVKLVDGKVAYVRILISGGPDVETYKYYDYGKTVPVIPENAEPIPQE